MVELEFQCWQDAPELVHLADKETYIRDICEKNSGVGRSSGQRLSPICPLIAVLRNNNGPPE